MTLLTFDLPVAMETAGGKSVFEFGPKLPLEWLSMVIPDIKPFQGMGFLKVVRLWYGLLHN